jgi:hypothetical protein
LYKTADQIADDKWRIYEWFGVVIGIDQTKMAKKLFESEPYSTKKVGRAQLRWQKDAENYLRVLEAKRWRQNDNNREEWRSVVKEAKFLDDHRDSK